MVHRRAGKRHEVIVTRFARLVSWDVTCTLAGRGGSVVACGAAGGDTVVVHFCTGKTYSTLVTRLARIAGWNMLCDFSRCRLSVVARGAACRDTGMVHAGI